MLAKARFEKFVIDRGLRESMACQLSIVNLGSTPQVKSCIGPLPQM